MRTTLMPDDHAFAYEGPPIADLPYDRLVFATGPNRSTLLYARKEPQGSWYELVVRDPYTRNDTIAGLTFEDPHGGDSTSGTVEMIGSDKLILSLPPQLGRSRWAIYDQLPSNGLPTQGFSYNPLPIDVREVAYMALNTDLTRRIAVIGSRYHPGRHYTVYEGPSYGNMPLTAVTSDFDVEYDKFGSDESFDYRNRIYMWCDDTRFTFQENSATLLLQRP